MFIYKSPVIHPSKYSIILPLTGPYLYLPKMINVLCADHITRHDMGVEESIGESSHQFCIQWIFYLLLVSSAVKQDGPEAATDITFESLRFSSIASIISLSLGQFKVLSCEIGLILIKMVNRFSNIFVLN